MHLPHGAHPRSVARHLSDCGDPSDLAAVERGNDAIANIQPVALGHHELHERRDTPIALRTDPLHSVAALEGHAKGQERGAVVWTHDCTVVPDTERPDLTAVDFTWLPP